MSAATVERTLHRTRSFRLAEFWCPPESPRWRAPNTMPPAAHVVFPRTSAVIRHAGGEPVLANAAHAMFYNPGQRYLRGLHDPRGDRCWFVELEPLLLAELGAPAGFAFASGPGDLPARLLVHAAVRHLGGDRADPLLAEEALLEALARTVAAAAAFHGARRAGAERHGELVESAKELLTETACERLSLEELARRLHVSAFHLARVFRAGTGTSLHRYRTHLRLVVALERLAEPDVDLASLALDLGYASHSHFTDRFRSVVGVPPSTVRGGVGRRRLRELHRLAAARLP